jgi:hypothetical protein
VNRTEFIEIVEAEFGEHHIFTKDSLVEFCKDRNIEYQKWLVSKEYRFERGSYKVPLSTDFITPIVKEIKKPKIMEIAKPSALEEKTLIPTLNPFFEKFGFYTDLKKIISGKKFFPVFITGLSGGGKTILVNQICAELQRECVRINFSVETDKTDLIGSDTLINGNIVFEEGPVLQCLRNGWVLLLDEIDRSNPNNILILNGILEGEGYYNPKTAEYIPAADGFNVIATANSKGYGDDNGKFLSQILDTAFLERFPITLEQDFPSEKLENKIVQKHLDDIDFAEKLVKWARVIRKTYENGGISEIVSTRRLVHIAEAYNIFNNKLKAINYCISRFDESVKESFLDLYKKIDDNIEFDDNGNPIEETEGNPMPM